MLLNPQVDSPPFAATVAAPAAEPFTTIPERPGQPPLGLRRKEYLM